MPDADTENCNRCTLRESRDFAAHQPWARETVKYEIIQLRDGTRLKLVKDLNRVRKCHRKSLEDFPNFQDSINQMELLRVVNPQINRYAYGE